MSSLKLIYLLGAGRSGTTILATILGNIDGVLNLGEMHQFYDHIRDEKLCSCGVELNQCEFWAKVLNELPKEIIEHPALVQKTSDDVEYHSSIPRHFLGFIKKSKIKYYNKFQTSVFKGVEANTDAEILVDSAKYIGRFLSLKRNDNINLKGIYLVRDVRGVINSFGKKVQSSRSPLSTIFYYSVVNSVAQIVYMFNKDKILKIKYEDIISQPHQTMQKIGVFIDKDVTDIVQLLNENGELEMGHIIGGNRLKQNKRIRISFDEKWKTNITRLNQKVYYILTLPFMLINKYKL